MHLHPTFEGGPKSRLPPRFPRYGDQYTCQYCGKKTQEMTLDHVVPRRQHGPHTWENVVAACPRCNLYKAGRTPEEANMRLSRAPRVPQPNPYRMLQNRIILESWRAYIPWSMKE